MTPEQKKKLVYEALGLGMGSIRMYCACGRTHFATHDDGAGWIEGEIEELREKAKADPKHYIEDSQNDSVSGITFGGSVRVWDCPCEWEVNAYNFLVTHRAQIIRFFKQQADEAKKQADAAAADVAAMGQL